MNIDSAFRHRPDFSGGRLFRKIARKNAQCSKTPGLRAPETGAFGTGRGAAHPQEQTQSSAASLKSVDVTEYRIPTPNSGAGGWMAVGPDGNLWFTEGNSSKVASITP
jgi:hypothetical protein